MDWRKEEEARLWQKEDVDEELRTVSSALLSGDRKSTMSDAVQTDFKNLFCNYLSHTMFYMNTFANLDIPLRWSDGARKHLFCVLLDKCDEFMPSHFKLPVVEVRARNHRYDPRADGDRAFGSMWIRPRDDSR